MTSNNILIIVLLAAVFWFWQAADRAERRAADAEAREYTEQQLDEINKRMDVKEKDLQNGGEDGLSDYLRDAAGILWP